MNWHTDTNGYHHTDNRKFVITPNGPSANPRARFVLWQREEGRGFNPMFPAPTSEYLRVQPGRSIEVLKEVAEKKQSVSERMKRDHGWECSPA